MAGGRTRDGAVNEQIDALPEDELQRMCAMRRPVGASRSHCTECEKPIPEARQSAMPGVTLCADCHRERDGHTVPRGGINRRGSKDSPLR